MKYVWDSSNGPFLFKVAVSEMGQVYTYADHKIIKMFLFLFYSTNKINILLDV